MADKHIQSSKRILDPFARLAEVVCGLIMVVTFTDFNLDQAVRSYLKQPGDAQPLAQDLQRKGSADEAME